MEEKILLKSEQYNVKKLCKWVFWIAAVAGYFVIDFVCWGPLCSIFTGDADWYFGRGYLTGDLLLGLLTGFGAGVLLAGLIYLWIRSYELTITNKRIYGKIAWGKRVDLPVDSVSATAMVSLFKGVSVSTSSGRISFLVIKNADEIYKVMNNLLIERQQEKEKPATTVISQQSDEADQLKKYKDLLDSGVISQEEFDTKKKQLLGL